MKLNVSKTKTMIVPRSRTMHPQSPALTIGRTVLKESDDLVIFGVTFYSKMTFEKRLRSVSRAASQRLFILRKSWQVFHDRLLLGRRFQGFVLPVLEYCSAVWCLAADTHLRLRLLDRIVSGASFLTGGVLCLSVTLHIVDLWQYCVCCTRSGVTRNTLFVVSSCAVCAGAGYTQRRDRTSVHSCASSLQNFAVSQAFYTVVSISTERS